jgi:hypothetical protein
MQATINSSAEENLESLLPEEQQVTFQIVMVGRDGLVVGSDQLGQHMRAGEGGRPQIPQTTYQPKYSIGANRSIVCFAAGGSMAPNVARRIVSELDPESTFKGITGLEWETAIHQVARTEPIPYLTPVDELLIIRKDVSDAFWMVARRLAGQNVVTVTHPQRHTGCFCTGTNTEALFLPRHLWNANRSVTELKQIALLALSYAAQEQPQSVGPPFDIMVLDKSGHMTWTQHTPNNDSFQAGLERLFAECGGR